MAKRPYDVLRDSNKEEEVKSEFCKFFKMKINALKSIDRYAPTILFEFKYDRNFKNAGTMAHVIAQTVMDAAKSPYRKFYAEIANTNWMDAKIETWDVGYYQICKALKEVGLAADEFAALKTAHDALRAKLLPKVYEYGFLNPGVEYFQ